MGRLIQSNAGKREGKEWETETFAYDGNGRLLLAENKDCKLQWFYDLAGNNTREHQHFKYMKQPKVAVFTHEYDALNLRIATTRPDGHRVSWLTYGSGHLLGLKFDDRELLSYQRDDLHREIGREQGNGLIQRQTWSANGQLLEQTLAHRGATKRVAARNYRYDESGQLTHVKDLNRGDTYYRYDPVGRLLEATHNYNKETFAFDPASNLLDPDAPPGPNPHSPRRINDNVLRSYCGTQYRYDERGNLRERIENGKSGQFVWDLYNRLRRYEDDRLIVDFAYDALGRRLYKNSRSKYRDRPQAGPVWNENARRQREEELGCGFTWFTWDGDTLATECRDREERSGSTTHYVFEPGTFIPVAQAVNNSALELLPQPTYGDHYRLDRDPVWLYKPKPEPISDFSWYQCDHLGTPIEVTDEHGKIVWLASYKAWGQVEDKTGETSKRTGIRNQLRFQGQYFDVETGLHYSRHRYYAPDIGRFISRDPISFSGGLNIYAYAPNPTRWIDPLGLSSYCPCECEKILESEGVVTGQHRDLKRIGGLQDSHHIYQDAAVKKLSHYNTWDAITVSIQGRNADGKTTMGTPHYRANQSQNNAPAGGLLGSETVVAFNSLRAAGLSPQAAKCATLKARGYLKGLGASAGSTTLTPVARTRRK